MSYWIRQDDITNVFYFSNGIISQTSEGVGKIAAAFDNFVGMESFSGAAAENIKAYIAEVHLTTLFSIGEIFTEFNSKFLLYRDGYFSIDSDSRAQLHEETLTENETFYTTNKSEVIGKSEELQGVINSISDIFSCPAPSASAIESDCTHITKTLNQLNQSIGDYEQAHLSDFDNLDKMMSSLNAFIESYSGGHKLSSYQSGDVMSLPSFNNLLTAVKDASEARNTEENKRVLSIASDHEEVRYKQLVEELAEQREADGWWMTISSGFEVAGGLAVVITSGVSLFATGFAAAPLAIPGIIGGIGMVTHGGSNMAQGINEIQLGRAGDPFTVASNPIRDSLFCGNQTAWDTFGLASNICGIIGSAGATGWAAAASNGANTSRAVLATIGKTVASVGIGYGTNYGVNKLYEATGWDANVGRYVALVLSIAASAATYLGLSKVIDPIVFRNGEAVGGISQEDRAKIDGWKYRPTDQQYVENKGVYDNPKYYNQKTGEIIWPPNHGAIEGTEKIITLEPGTMMDRFGDDMGSYTAPIDTPYEQRALAPGTNEKPYSKFEVIKPIEGVEEGQVAPWFDQPGKGTQYVLPKSVEYYIDKGYIRRIK